MQRAVTQLSSAGLIRRLLSQQEARIWTRCGAAPLISSQTVLNQTSCKVLVLPPSRNMAKGGKQKAKKDKTEKAVQKMIDDLVDDDEEDTHVEVDIQNSQLNKFLSGKGGGPSGGKKGGKGGGANIKKLPYQDFVLLVKGENVWRDMDNQLENLKKFYVQQLTVRSTSSLDELPIELEGDVFPLNELATISKKDPKRLIVDVSAFPQASKTIMEAIKNSGMNLNPQQEGLTIFVPIPKVTKEHRQNLVDGAKKKMTECKNDIRKIQNSYNKKINEDELSEKIVRDDSKAAQDTLKLISDHFQSQAEVLFNTKSKELMG